MSSTNESNRLLCDCVVIKSNAAFVLACRNNCQCWQVDKSESSVSKSGHNSTHGYDELT